MQEYSNYDKRCDAITLLKTGLSPEKICTQLDISPLILAEYQKALIEQPDEFSMEAEETKASKVLVRKIKSRLIKMGDSLTEAVERDISKCIASPNNIDMEYTEYLSKNVGIYARLMGAINKNNVQTVVNIATTELKDVDVVLQPNLLSE